MSTATRLRLGMALPWRRCGGEAGGSNPKHAGGPSPLRTRLGSTDTQSRLAVGLARAPRSAPALHPCALSHPRTSTRAAVADVCGGRRMRRAGGDKKVARKKKRFTYRSFAQRVATLDTNVFRKVGAARAEPAAGAETFFQVRWGGRACHPMPCRPTILRRTASASDPSAQWRRSEPRGVAMQGWSAQWVQSSTSSHAHGPHKLRIQSQGLPGRRLRTHGDSASAEHRALTDAAEATVVLYRRPSTSGGSSTRRSTS